MPSSEYDRICFASLLKADSRVFIGQSHPAKQPCGDDEPYSATPVPGRLIATAAMLWVGERTDFRRRTIQHHCVRGLGASGGCDGLPALS